jgi:Zn-dependent protease
MLRAWKVGKLFGIRVYVHWSCLLIVVLALGGGLAGTTPARALLSAALVPAVFLCVLLHEFGHALTAKLYGIRTRDITLYPIGGVARLEGLGKRPVEELCVALAGPAVNLVIAFLLTAALLPFAVGLDPSRVLDDTPANLAGAGLVQLLWANLVLAGFNLLPAFPMDGGRVLRSLLQLGLGRLRATEIAARIGLVIAVVIAVGAPLAIYRWWGFVHPAPVLVGLFVAYAGQRELWAVRRIEEERARERAEAAAEAAAEQEDIPEVLPAEPVKSPSDGAE